MRGGKKTAGFGKLPASAMTTCPRCNGSGKVAADGISIGDRLRSARQNLGKTQAEVAPELHISRAQVANLEGDRSRPGIEMIVLAADLYGVSVDWLLGRGVTP